MKIFSGGQTGVDRGALIAAIELGLSHGGWCPRGRLAEDGRIPDIFRLRETESADNAARTEKNVLDSDATLILYCRQLRGGTELTYRLAQRHVRPVYLVDLEDEIDFDAVRQWLATERIETLNVAGPRESQSPGIEAAAREFVVRLFST
jgi:hypothetical protein